MQDYIYEESRFIKRQDLRDYSNLMLEYDFMPEEIKDEKEFNIVFQYFVNLTLKAPDFLPAYENVIRMAACLEPDEEVVKIEQDVTHRWITACERVATKDKIFEKQVPWGYLENRPLVRGLYNKAELLWKKGSFDEAHDLFSKIYKTNENDNIGARFSIRAIEEKMTLDEFEKRFVIVEGGGSHYNSNELWKWYGEQ